MIPLNEIPHHRVYLNDSNALRSGNLNTHQFPELRRYRRSHDVRRWFFGDYEYFAGWHCSSCFDPEGIRTKFTSAINADFPRWGSLPEKMDLNYIKRLIENGEWFDGTSSVLKSDMNDELYAPQYMLRNKDKYKDILFNPYES